MRNYKECQDAIAQEHEGKNWDDIHPEFHWQYHASVAKLYAREVAQDALNRAASNSRRYVINLPVEEYSSAMKEIRATEILTP